MEELRERLSEEDIKGEFNLEDFLRQHKTPVFLGLIGLLFLLIGIFFILRVSQTEDKIEIISSSETQLEKENLLVDIEGAVEKPGVYQLTSGSRVEDLLIASGGLSSEADREWVDKSLNRAQKLSDGVKIFIPKQGESVKGSTSTTGTTGSSGLVNINTASQGELEALWGIGPVTAQKIIENRPYSQVDDLLTKKILKSNVYQRIVDQLTVY